MNSSHPSNFSSSSSSVLPGSTTGTSTSATAHHSPPCGACKFLRRKCVQGCVFAPHFGSEQGSAKFAAVHKIFGASNVSKLLMHIPVPRRHDAVVTVCYEAQARLADPVYGCVASILALQQQVATLQAELTILQSQVISNRLAMASALQSSQQSSSQCQLPQQHMISVLHPSYSNNSSTSNSMVMNLTSLGPSGLNPTGGHVHGLVSEGLGQLLEPPSQDEDEEEAEGESRTSSAVFVLVRLNNELIDLGCALISFFRHQSDCLSNFFSLFFAKIDKSLFYFKRGTFIEKIYIH
ncbi:putative transcription factor AS2-LOB family [Dioscorea sansibarensis]